MTAQSRPLAAQPCTQPVCIPVRTLQTTLHSYGYDALMLKTKARTVHAPVEVLDAVTGTEVDLLTVSARGGALALTDHSTAEHVAVAFLAGYNGHTRTAYGRDLRDYFQWCTAWQLDPLAATRAHVDAYARELAEVRGLAPSTVARRLVSIAGLYRYAVAEEVLTRSPVSHVRRPRVGEDTTSTGLDKHEAAALLSAAAASSPRDEALVALLVFNGLRVSEVTGATVPDVSSERGHRVLRVTRKGGKRATVPLAPRVAAALEVYLDGRTDGALFLSRTGKPLDRTAVWRVVRRLAVQAVPDKATTLHPHDLRHTFVTLALDAGVSLRHVQDAAGHADPRTTRRYDRARNNLDQHATYALAAFLPAPDGAS